MKLLALFTFLPIVLAQRRLSITNKCPSPITAYVKSATMTTQVSLPIFGAREVAISQDFAGFVYTDANGGSADGTQSNRAGFFLQNDQYYFVVDPTRFNTGIRVTPITNSSQASGFCPDTWCNVSGCSAYQQPPVGFPSPALSAPASPLNRCPGSSTSYSITFCPDNAFPSWRLHPNGNTGKCLDLRNNVRENGTPVQIWDCNDTPAQNWILNPGSTKVRLMGTNFCLDAGSAPGDNVPMKIWQCYDNLPAQQWFLTNDRRLALDNQGLCLDLPQGIADNGNQVQTYRCTDGNTNQVWFRPS
ncbi:hypothetical protein HGRIS_008749 [Hohenbuehelia grisea]|uniref:Ricin B lectin domain-containing protein n=1 Tax=Hohenbuehelia grisea TaxID=104357 RepID=A0ABR3JAF2_9AGAR